MRLCSMYNEDLGHKFKKNVSLNKVRLAERGVSVAVAIPVI